MSNEYLDIVAKLGVPIEENRSLTFWWPDDSHLLYTERKRLVKKYAWAIPTPRALDVISRYTPILEIGAGKGYWASLLDCEVVAYDVAFGKENGQTDDGECYYEVKLGGVEVIAEYPNHTLMLCWPPYNDDMAMECLQKYQGGKLIYIGEGYGGCTATDEFHEELDSKWEQIEIVRIPQWNGLHDVLRVYGKTHCDS